MLVVYTGSTAGRGKSTYCGTSSPSGSLAPTTKMHQQLALIFMGVRLLPQDSE
ncbi:hypothetical protein R4Z10_04240 [Niallia sp. XMNu-256]|uniref:hypothetical protein n=1 Tax=Niallia sp. XMNu-256 TaxID=3082444 RepID=UPI0030D3460E